MRAYIQSTSAISTQQTFDKSAYLEEWVAQEGEYYKAVEPVYKGYINPRLLRRMSRIIKMGVAAAKDALQQADVDQPDAIIVGTGLGCIDDTEKFLKSIIENEEGILSPTAFIQSTHNTVAGQIALLLQCTSYNYTYTNRGHSFENALVDAKMLLAEGKDNVLVGSAEEATAVSYDAINKLDCVGNNSDERAVLGEGSAFFVLKKEAKEGVPFLKDIATCGNLSGEEVSARLEAFLKKNELKNTDIDAVLLGANGYQSDKCYDAVQQNIGDDKPVIHFKRVSGEHFTASGLAMHLAATMLEKQEVFKNTMVSGNFKKPLKNVLIYNHYKQLNHTFMLLSI